MNKSMHKASLSLAALIFSLVIPVNAMETDLVIPETQEIVTVEEKSVAWYKKESIQKIASLALVTCAAAYTIAASMNKVVSPLALLNFAWMKNEASVVSNAQGSDGEAVQVSDKVQNSEKDVQPVSADQNVSNQVQAESENNSKQQSGSFYEKFSQIARFVSEGVAKFEKQAEDNNL